MVRLGSIGQQLRRLATLDERTFASTFSGLKSTAITAGCFIVGGVLLKEVLQRLRRYPEEDARRNRGERVRDRGVEGWAMGYVYRARSYVAGPRTAAYTGPLAWIIEAYKLDEAFYETHCGADATVYVRFLRGCFFWTTFLVFTLFPLLMSINYLYARSDFSADAIDRASLTALVQGKRGLHLLPIHVVSVWVVVLTWMGMLAWLGYGALHVRRNELRHLLRDDAERHLSSSTSSAETDGAKRPPLPPITSLDFDSSIPASDIGWRYRTVLVRNIPPLLRTDESLREYFERYLRDEPSSTPSDSPPTEKHEYPPARAPASGESSPPSPSPGPPRIAEVVLVRRQTELNQLFFTRYREVLHQLETAHVQLARAVMAWVRERIARDAGEPPRRSARALWKKHVRRADVEHEAREGDDLLLARLAPFLDPAHGDDLSAETLWEALSALQAAQPSILDRFQPLYRLRYFGRQAVPAIDYFLLKHNLLFSLIESKRARPDTVEAASTAFVTFERADDARRARTQLKWRPIRSLYRGRVFDCKVTMAPELRDIHWPRIVLVSLSSDLLRGTILQAVIWAITIIWVLPISVLIGLLSLESLREHVPKLADFLDRNPVAQSVVTSLLPTVLMALLNMYTPTVIGLIQRHGRTIITESKWMALTQSSYWKFQIINLLVIFSVGTTAFTAVLNAFNSPLSVFDVVASAFPKAATFYVSYLGLQIGVHTGVELSMLGISWINHASIRKYVAPRKRALENIPRFFGAQTWLPNHLFVIAISLVFAVLNPLVLAFAWLYFAFSVIVLKSQFAHVYYRRNFELGGRLWYRRILRYSLDIIILASFIMVAFFWVLREFACGGACIPLIPIAVAVKILGTRWFDHLMDEIEEAQIDAICGEGDPIAELSVPLTTEERTSKLTFAEAVDTVKTFATVTLPALALRPAARLPPVSAPSRLAAHYRARTEQGAASDRMAKAQAQGARPRASTAPDDWRRPMLEPVVSSDGSATSESARASQQLEERPSLHAVDYAAAQATVPEKAPVAQVEEDAPAPAGEAVPVPSAKEQKDESPTPRRLVTPHPPIIRDDRPVSHLRYRNPAESEPLSRALWLPRDPLLPVDLGDTVDYHGRALVSSAGGRGIIGLWDEAETELDEEEGEEHGEKGIIPTAPLFHDGEAAPATELKRVASRLTDFSIGDGAYTLKGNERVRVAADVAAKVQQETPAVANVVRRSTRASSTSRRSSFMTPSPHHSPVLVRHPHSPRPSPPAIPIFTDEPEALAEPAASPSSPAFPFPPETPTPASRTRGNSLLPPSPTRTRARRSPSASSAAGAGGPTTPRTTRSARSASLAPSMLSTHSALGHLRLAASEAVILEEEAGGAGEGPTVSISQSAAVRSELLEEERRSHMAHRRQEEHRLAMERREREEGGEGKSPWWRRLLVRQDLQGEADET
ncbi:hypothetical protein JCM10450v2_002023 [Rhodotorula kratochvilovae]